MIKIYSERVIKEKTNLGSYVKEVYKFLTSNPEYDPCSILTEQGKRVAVVSFKTPEYNTHPVKN